MKQRNIMAVIFLSIITFGIYDIYWLAKTKKVLNEQTDIHTPTLWLLFGPIILLFVVVVAAVTVTASSSSDGSSAGAALVVIIAEVLSILAIVPTTFYWFFKFSKAIGKYTHGEMSTAVTFLLLYMLRFIGMAVVQDHFNDMATAGAAGGKMPMQNAGATPNMGASMPTTFDQPAATPSATPDFEQPAPVNAQSFDPTQPSAPANPEAGSSSQSPTDAPHRPIQ